MENDIIFNRAKLYQLETARVVEPLDDLRLIEDATMTIKEVDKKIAFYKDYKKKKNEDISKAINSLEDKVAFYKSIILVTLESKNEKNVSFPGSCKITKRKSPDKWVIKDEEAFRDSLKGTPEEKKVVQEMMQYIIDKKEANKVLKAWEKSGKLNDISDSIDKEEGKVGISISFLEDKVVKSEVEEAIPVKNKKENYDSLEF